MFKVESCGKSGDVSHEKTPVILGRRLKTTIGITVVNIFRPGVA